MPQIAIIGEAHEEDNQAEPFTGATAQVLRGILRQTGIAREDCFFTNIFNSRPPAGDVFNYTTTIKDRAMISIPPLKKGHWIRQEHAGEIARLWRELEREKPNIVVALGPTALAVAGGKVGVKRWRGSPMLTARGDYKLLTTWHPSSILRQWELRPVVVMDFHKVRREAESPRLIRPRRFVHLEPTLDDIEDFYLKHIIPAPFIAADIETKAGQITEIGFAASARRAIVIPFWSRARGNYWPDVKSERAAWTWVRRILEEKPTVGQNFKYDMQYLWRTMGIASPRFIGDTMLLHHSLQPELEKGLGFLGSIYTDEPSWKFMRTDHSTLKKEDD